MSATRRRAAKRKSAATPHRSHSKSRAKGTAMKRLMLTSFAALGLIVATAAAQPAAQPAPNGNGKPEFLRTYDTALDGAVSRAEFDAQRGREYTRTDANSDGSLTEDEYVGDYTTRLDAELAEMRQRQVTQAHSRFGVLDT